jgi:hypothetical protein
METQVFPAWAENKSMNISGVSSNMDALAVMATKLKADQVGPQISVAVLKEVLDTQKLQGDELAQMIHQTPSADGAGQLVDILA